VIRPFVNRPFGIRPLSAVVLALGAAGDAGAHGAGGRAEAAQKVAVVVVHE